MGFGGYWSAPGKFTAVDLADVAAGSGRGEELLVQLRRYVEYPWVLGPERLMVAWQPPSGVRTEFTSWGWPPWFMHSRQEQFEDVFERKGPVARDWGVSRHSFWSGTTYYGSGTGTPTLADEYSTIWPEGATWFALVVVFGSLVGPFFAVRIAKARGKQPPRKWVARVWGAMIVLTIGLSLAAIFPNRVVSYGLGPIQVAYPGASSTTTGAATDWTAEDLLGAAKRPGGSAALARQILAALPPPEDNCVLVYEVEGIPGRTGQATSCGWPWMWVHVEEDSISPDCSDQIHNRGLRGGFWTTSYTTAGPGWVRMVSVYPIVIATYTLAGIVLWSLLRGLARLIEWRLIRRRRVRGLCMACGYDLAGLPASAG
jgi:hypothetical protein